MITVLLRIVACLLWATAIPFYLIEILHTGHHNLVWAFCAFNCLFQGHEAYRHRKRVKQHLITTIDGLEEDDDL